MTGVQNIVLVHGGFVDGSGWRGVYDVLTADGFNVSVVQNQTLSLESDVETTTNMLDLQDGPAILVGHSYGGAVISEAGTHDLVAGLVYICAFAPDRGESVSTLLADLPSDGPLPPILPPQDGFLFLDREKFAEAFAADVPAADASFMADSQVPWGVEALNGAVTEPAWRSRPTWYMVTTEDHMIPPPTADDGRAGRRDDDRGVRQPCHLRLPALRRRQRGHAGGTDRARREFRGLSSSRGRQDARRPAGRRRTRAVICASGHDRGNARARQPGRSDLCCRVASTARKDPCDGNSRPGIMSRRHPAIPPARRDSGRALGS